MIKKWLALALKFVVSGALIWFLLSNIDLASAKARLLEVAPGMLAACLGVLMVQMAFIAVRWQAVLAAIESPLPFAEAVRIYWIGIFFNQTLPSSVGGDAVRMYIARRHGLTLSGAVNGVLLERAAIMVTLVLLVAAMQPVFLPRVGAENQGWIMGTVALFFVGALAGLGVLMALDRMPGSLHRWRIVRGLAMLAADARKVFLSPLDTAKVLFWCLAGHVNVTFALFLLALGLGLEVTFVDCLALFPPVLLVTTLPISVAGWGVREGAMVAAFALVGVPNEGALVLSLLFGLIGIVMALPGGVIWLLSRDRRTDISEAAAETEAEALSADKS